MLRGRLRHLEFACVGAVFALVAVGRPVEQQHLAARRGSWCRRSCTSRVVVRARPCTGEVSRSNSSTASGIRSGLFDQQPALIRPLVQQLHRAAQHAGRGVVAAGDHRERERQDRQHAGDVAVGADARGDEVRDRVVLGLAAAAFDQLGEVGHHRRHRVADGLDRAGDAAGRGVGGDDGLGPAVELLAVLLRNAEVVRDDHRRQRLEQFGDDVAAAVRRAAARCARRRTARTAGSTASTCRGVKPAGHQLAELGVHRRVLHDERRVVGQPDHFQLAVVDGQALRRGERLVVAGGVPTRRRAGTAPSSRGRGSPSGRRGAPDRGRAAPRTSATGWARSPRRRAGTGPERRETESAVMSYGYDKNRYPVNSCPRK